MTGSDGSPIRRLRLILRDHRVLTANARVAQGQDLFNYLASRTRYLNLTDVEWLGTREKVGFLGLKTDQILWAASEDGALSLTRGLAAKSAKRVELELEGGYLVAGGLLLIEDQRVSDYFRSAPRFVPLCDAALRPRERPLGDVVIHQDAIHIVREMPASETDPEVEGDGATSAAQDDDQASRFQSVQDITAGFIRQDREPTASDSSDLGDGMDASADVRSRPDAEEPAPGS